MLAEIRLVIVLIAMLALPGWAMLAVSNTWRQWAGLQRWIVAVGLSIAFYPVLFYGLRSALPFLTLGPVKMGVLLLAAAVVIAWRLRGHWKEQFTFERLEWLAIAVFGMTLFSRFWFSHLHPFPAWSDSLHHTLLTQLTAQQGRLPSDMEPFFPIPLGQYHLGLYSLSASLQWLAQASAPTAMLWVAQALNGLCGLGVYLVLDRKVGRTGAVVGAVVVGLLSHQPAFYVNWGRFTQLASQTILLIAWIVTWEAMAMWRHPWREWRARILWNTAFAALLSGAVFLLHFRVVAFYLPLILISALWELYQAHQRHNIRPVLLGLLAIGIAGLAVISPALWSAMDRYVTPASSQSLASAEQVSQTIDDYYGFPWTSVPYLTGHIWLLVLAGASAVIGLLRRNKLTIVCILWTVALCLLGTAYVLGMRILKITNWGAVLIMLYLPIGLVVGAAVEEVLALVKPTWRPVAFRLTVILCLVAGFVASHVRVAEIEAYRQFITPADVDAMIWIRENTPPDAVFAVNTHFWLPMAPHGTDAGYWIPYFTGRKTTAGSMLNDLGTGKYLSSILALSTAVERLETDRTALDELYALGVHYIYIGQQGDFSGPGLDAEQLAQADNARQVYRSGDTFVFEIVPP